MKRIAIIILTISLITSCASKKASCEAYGKIENKQETKNNL